MEKEHVSDILEIEKIINESGGICQLGMVDGDRPYCIPMNFGYDSGIIYFHSGMDGKKIKILKNKPDVCVSFYSNAELNIRHENVACSHSMRFKSVLAHGKVCFVVDINEKQRILNILMKNYVGRNDFVISAPALENVSVFYLKPSEITAFNRGCK